jgi:hypothetical protein
LPLRFRPIEAQDASDVWGFNCGPAALCAVLHLTPAELRHHLIDFEQKGYTNPTLMGKVLRGFGVWYRQVYRSDDPRYPGLRKIPLRRAVMRVQWGGPWTKPGVPMQARYRQTHWVAVRNGSAEVYDVNADDWLPRANWEFELVPWLIKEAVPKADGTWWPTHAYEIEVAP